MDSDILEQLFGSKTRVRLLRLLLEHPERAYFVRELTRRINAQLNSVRREIMNLLEIGIVIEVDNPVPMAEVNKAKRGAATKKKFYQANPNFLFFEELKGIMKKSSLLLHNELLQALRTRGDVKLLLLTGKMLDVNVPTDILIVGSIEPASVREAVQFLEEEMGRELNYTHMPVDEFNYRREVKDRFLGSIMEGKHILVLDELDHTV